MSNPAPIFCVFSQPAASLATWAARGVSLAVRYEPETDATGRPTVSADAWDMGAFRCHLSTVIQSDAVPDYENTTLAGVLCPWDEPDANDPTKRIDPQKIADDAAAAIGKGAEAYFISFDALQLELYQGSADAGSDLSGYFDYRKLASLLAPLGPKIVVCGDMYPANRGRRADVGALKTAEQRTLAILFPAARRGSFVECSDQGLLNLGPSQQYAGCPSVAEFAAQVKAVAASGASYVIYFPQHTNTPPGFAYDATPWELVAAMKELAAGVDPAAPPRALSATPIAPKDPAPVQSTVQSPSAPTLDPAKIDEILYRLRLLTRNDPYPPQPIKPLPTLPVLSPAAAPPSPVPQQPAPQRVVSHATVAARTNAVGVTPTVPTPPTK